LNIQFTRNVGFFLLALWLIITGALTALSVGNMVISVLLGIMAVVTGVFVLLGR